jgi:YesN/AraC family two-component response regulator
MTTARILLIDDDPAVLIALPETLRLWMPGSIVDICGSARMALDRIETTDYDAVISDIRMPDLDGLSILERIRTVQPHTPTILITGHGDHSLAVQALRGGAYDYILKPVDREYFLNSLSRAIQLRQLSRQAEQQKAALERYANEVDQMVEARFHDLREDLQRRIQERTAELEHVNEALQSEVIGRRQAEQQAQAYARKAMDLEASNAALRDKLLDLEKSQEAAKSRECRMIDLEKRITLLQQEVDTFKGAQGRV